MSSKNEPQHDPEYHDNDEVIERNVERAREVIESRKHSENAGKARRPAKNDPNSPKESALPNQWDLPAGGQSSGPNVGGGSSKRHKP